ncbi:hypothetical protein GZH53_08530 [Flavihumibacter sp. R14]|nr:hypothetical protein [Flavihumibacter soli]
MAQLHLPHFPHFSRKVIFYGIATIPASLIVYTIFRLIENLVMGRISF